MLTFDLPVSTEMFDNLIAEVPKVLGTDVSEMLIDRREQEVTAKLSAGILFGASLGKMLLQRGVKVALLSSGRHGANDIVAAQVYNHGVPLAQFDSEKEAQLWLKGCP